MSQGINVFVGLQYRDRLSVGENRVRLGLRAFHWSVIVQGQRIHRFDVTDGIVQDPITLQDINPDRVWVYRHLITDSFEEIPRYLGRVKINKDLLKSATTNDIESIMAVLPVPDAEAERTENNCLSWAMDGVRALQKQKYCQDFDIEDMQRFALLHADERLADYRNVRDPVDYPPSMIRAGFWRGASRWIGTAFQTRT